VGAVLRQATEAQATAKGRVFSNERIPASAWRAQPVSVNAAIKSLAICFMSAPPKRVTLTRLLRNDFALANETTSKPGKPDHRWRRAKCSLSPK
jgi:hypothetical protein